MSAAASQIDRRSARDMSKTKALISAIILECSNNVATAKSNYVSCVVVKDCFISEKKIYFSSTVHTQNTASCDHESCIYRKVNWFEENQCIGSI